MFVMCFTEWVCYGMPIGFQWHFHRDLTGINLTMVLFFFNSLFFYRINLATVQLKNRWTKHAMGQS